MKQPYKMGSANYYRMVGVEKIYDLYDDYRCTSEWRKMTRRMVRVRYKAHLRSFINEYKYNKGAYLCI